MKFNYLFILVFLLIPVFSNAQFCSEEEKEVWTVVVDWWDNWKNMDMEAAFATVSDKYEGWNQERPLTVSKTKWMKQMKEATKYTTLREYDLDPVKVVVYKDAAVVHYYYSMYTEWAYKDEQGTYKANGKWSEFFVKEKGKWKLIGDMTTWDPPEEKKMKKE